MLQTIHDKLKGIFALVILIALGVVFVFWGVDVSVGTFTKARGIEVNGREIAIEEVRRSYQDELSRFQAAMGAAGVPEEMRVSLQKRVLDQAVRTELIRQRTKKLDFQASNEEILEAIRQVPAFQVAGQFSPDAYHAALRSIGMSPDRFEAEQREYVLARQLDRGLYNSAFVLPGELERQVALRNETRILGWVSLPALEFLDAVKLDDAAIQAHYEAHKARYQTEEQATVDFIELDIESFAAKAVISDEQLRQFYEENQARYTQAGRRHVRHILIEAGDDAVAAEARARKATERASAGEDFAALANELSDDTGSKDSGGDLGFAERGDFVAPFADAAWSMKPGEIRGPVKTDFGWHVIKLESVAEESIQGFDEVRAELEPELRRAQVEKAFGDAQEELDTLAFEAAGDLAAVATKMNLPLKRIPGFTRAGGPDLGATPKLIEAVFSPDVLAGRELRTVELAPGRVVALGVSAHVPASGRPLEEVRAQVVDSARLAEAGKRASARAAEVAAELSKGAAWEAATAKWHRDGATQAPRPVRRDDASIPAEIREAAFRAKSAAGKPQFGVAALANGDSAIWTVTGVESGKFATLPADQQKQEHDAARDRSAMSDAMVYITSMRSNADVDVNPQVFE
jgi:peptidyl-prolyl cis-trans isomerase D